CMVVSRVSGRNLTLPERWSLSTSPWDLDCLANIFLVVRCQMEASENGVHLSDARYRDRLLHRVHYAAVPTGGRDHQPASLDVDAGRNLVVELVRSPIDRAAVRRHLVGETPEAVVNSDLHPGRRQHPFECCPRYVTSGEGMVGDHRRSFGGNDRQDRLRYGVAIECAEIEWRRSGSELT